MQRTLLLTAFCLTASIAFTQNPNTQPLDVKTGLWQVTATTGVGGVNGITDLPPDMQAKLNQMTPEQRAQTEAMLKSRYGGGPRTNSYKKCVTAKDLNSNAFSDTKCTWTVLKSTSSEMDVKGSACNAGKDEGMTVSDVHVKIQALDSEHVKGSMNATATGNGRNYPISGNYVGKWLGGACSGATE